MPELTHLTDDALLRAVSTLVARDCAPQLVPGRVAPVEAPVAQPGLASPPAPATPAASVPHVVLRLALPEATHAKLRHAQALLAHAAAGADAALVVDRALDVLIAQLECRKFAATKRPRKPSAAKGSRTVPAHAKRAVWQRDEGRCAFVSPRGRRCSARALLEFDHVDPVARGGTAQADRMRLLCRAHNQFEAERVFGRAFMRPRREAPRATRPGSSCAGFDQAAPGQHPPAAPDPAR